MRALWALDSIAAKNKQLNIYDKEIGAPRLEIHRPLQDDLDQDCYTHRPANVREIRSTRRPR